MSTNGSEHRPSRDRSEWQGYEWHVHLDEFVDCDKCSPGCRKCYYTCRGLPVACKAAMITALLASTILLTALIIRFGMFGPGAYLAGSGDQIQFSDDSSQNDDNGFSRLFCSDFSLASTSSSPQNFSSFVVMTKSRRSTDRLHYHSNDTISLNYGSYLLYAVHDFDRTDSVSILGCVHTDNVDAIMYVILGDKNYKTWQDHSLSCSSCYSRREIFKPCKNRNTEVHMTFSSTDIVYFVYTLGYGFPLTANVSLKYTFDRARFEKEEIADSCVNTTSCKLTIPLHAVDIIIEQGVGLQLKENFNRIRTVCGARISIYFAFFVGVPAAAIIVCTIISLILKRCQDDLIRDMEQSDRVREYQRFGGTRENSSRPPTTTGRNNRDSSERPRFSSSSLSANRALSVSATVPLVESEQPVGSLPPGYNSLVTNEPNQRHTPINEPPPPTYQTVACGTVIDGQSEHDQEPPPPSYDDVNTIS